MCFDRLKTDLFRCLVLAVCAAAYCGSAAPVRAQDAEHADAAQEDHGDGAHDHGDAATGADGHGDAVHGDAAHGDGEHVDYNFPPLIPQIPLLIWSLVVFGLFLVLAKKLAWVPLIQGLDSREARVNRALAEAEQARIAARQMLDDHKAHLDRVTDEVKEIIAKARGEAEQEKLRIVAEAEAEATAIRDRAIADIHAAREQAFSGLDERIDAQVDLASRHVLG